MQVFSDLSELCKKDSEHSFVMAKKIREDVERVIKGKELFLLIL